LGLLVAVTGAQPRTADAVLAAAVPVAAPQVERNPERNAYFGETHQHTSWSFDAYIFGNHLTGPADAYKYWNGETIKHPLGYDIKIETPLDFARVTDHSEYAGVVRLANDPTSPPSKMPLRKIWWSTMQLTSRESKPWIKNLACMASCIAG
jgi:Protein of unknown function (DUF3604)